MKKLSIATTVCAAALTCTTALTPGSAVAGGLFGDGGLIRGSVGDFFDEHVEKKITTPLAQGVERTIKDTVEIAEDGLKGALAVSGLKTLEDVLIEGKSLEASLDEALDDAKQMLSAGAEIPALINHSTAALTEVTGNVLGDSAQDVVGVLMLPTSIAANLPSAIMDTALATSENIDNAADVVGIPLNAALKQVQDYYAGQGSKIPEKVKLLLGETFTNEQLENVRYVVDDSTGNLAGLINSLQTQFGTDGNHAVVVGNLIIFDQEPNAGAKDLFFWAHEVQHTVQYSEMGLDGFAAEYVVNFEGIENDANEVAKLAVDNALAFVRELLG